MPLIVPTRAQVESDRRHENESRQVVGEAMNGEKKPTGGGGVRVFYFSKPQGLLLIILLDLQHFKLQLRR